MDRGEFAVVAQMPQSRWANKNSFRRKKAQRHRKSCDGICVAKAEFVMRKNPHQQELNTAARMARLPTRRIEKDETHNWIACSSRTRIEPWHGDIRRGNTESKFRHNKARGFNAEWSNEKA